MSTPDQPDAPQLTRRQLRELRNTASTPIITPEEAAAAAAEAESAPAPVAPLPRAAEPVDLPDAPALPDETEHDESDGPVLTRRQVRDRERLRTASVPVQDADAVLPDEAEAPEGADDEGAADEEETAEQSAESEETVEAEVVEEDDADQAEDVAGDESRDAEGEEEPASTAEDSPWAPPAEDVVELDVISVGGDESPSADDDPTPDEDADSADEDAVPAEDARSAEKDDESAAEEHPAETGADAEPITKTPEPEREVSPTFGAGLLAGEAVEIDLPPSFDQVLGRGSGGTSSPATSNALILSQTPETGAFTAPVTATGEVLITGTFLLPDTYGSTGSAPGTADGKDIDAVLIDGELPATSSPTPIAASSAISTIKAADDIIKPPAPEKGSRLMMVLAITAGVLAVALAGVLILAFATGVL